MSTDDRDDRIEDLLRTTLQDEAESVHPAGDGLARIQQRVAARRARLRWLRPVAVVGSAAALTAGGFAAFALVNNNSNDTQKVLNHNPTPTEQPSVTPSVTPVTTPGSAHFPARAIYPFTSAAEEANWEAAGAGSATPEPQQVAVTFAQDFLQQPSLSMVTDTMLSPNGRTATVTLGRKLQVESHKTLDVTKVRLVRFNKAWLVIGADDAGGLLKVTSPTPGQPVSSPLAVSGPGFGVDEAVRLQLFTAHNGTVGDAAHVSFGNGVAIWTTRLTFTTAPEPVAAVVAIDDSMADNLPGRITVVPVRLGSDVVAASYPDRFVGIKNGRVTVLVSRNGAALRYLTDQQPGGGTSDPQLEGQTVYYLRGTGTCGNVLMSVPMSGGASTRVAAPDNGYAISGYAVSADGTKTALFEESCSGGSNPRGKLVSTDRVSSRTHTIAFPAFPPDVVADPTWEPDGVHLDAFVKTGNDGSLVRYDAFQATAWDDSQPACSGFGINDGLPTALEFTADGRLWVAAQTGGTTVVWGCTGGTLDTHIPIPGSGPPEDVDAAPNGQALLVTDVNGKLWRWTEQDHVVALHPKVPMTQVSW